MTAYSLSDRFSQDPEYYRFYDPGAYQYEESYKTKPAHAPFLSKAPRKTTPAAPIWTHTIYNPDISSRIPNCTSMMSKIPRFPYEAFSKEDLEKILCNCGFPTSCKCPTEDENEQNIVCQGKVPKHIIKGTPPRTGGDSGLSVPSRGDRGFHIRQDGIQKRLKDKVSNACTSFYDTRVNEATMFYHGWKWSKWASNRTTKPLEQSPGPADYTFEKEPNEFEKCAEKVRARKRKESKQYRFIEMVQRRNILENRPGPATYSPMSPKGTNLQELGPKADRFLSSKYNVYPGPADHNVKRDFDPPATLVTNCKAVLPEPSFFGVKAKRFKPRIEEGPSPASYYAVYKPCQFLLCSKAPFGSTAERFKTMLFDEGEEDETLFDENEDSPNLVKPCPAHTWEFKSKTIRMKPLVKCWDQPSPADYLLDKPKFKRPLHLQYLAPFCSSDGRLKPWYNWISVFGNFPTPGPGHYNPETPRCYPAVNRGPLYRDRRFRSPISETPGPGAYNVGGGIETILDTQNHKLKHNVEKQNKLYGIVTPERKELTLQEKETLLMNRCIALCDESIHEVSSTPLSQEKKIDVTSDNTKEQKKMMRFFLYRHQVPIVN